MFQNLDILRSYEPDYILILAGDHVYKMDYGEMLAYHVAKNADMTVACIEVPVEEAKAFGVMAVDDDWRVAAFHEKPANPPSDPGKPGRRARQHGHLCLQRAISVRTARAATPMTPNSSHDFGKDIIPHLVPRYRVFAHASTTVASGSTASRRTGATWARWMPIGKRTWS